MLENNCRCRSPLMSSLAEAGWCNELISLMNTAKDYDAKEKVIQALVVSVDVCSVTIKKHMNVMKHEMKVLENSIAVEDDIDFKSYLISLKDQLQQIVMKTSSNQLDSS